jgi:hypothetical protein
MGREAAMKLLTAFIGMCLAFILMLPLHEAQGKEGVRSGGESAGSARPSPNAAAGAGGGGHSATGTASTSLGSTSSAGTAVYQPNLRGTSFQTVNSYYMWNNYYSYLSTSFDVSPVYFDRFYRNTEPLITPVMLKLTLGEPIRLSSEMLDSIDRLQEMLEASPSGASADRQALAEKSRHIRELAKRIRHNQTLSYIDLRENKNLYNNGEHDTFNPEAMQKLRGMATDLDRQLRNMYRQSATSTVSAESYKEPSLESLTKGIEKICKVIESYSKRL